MRSINGNSDIVGYRFYPTDKEVVDHYLSNKILGRDSLVQAINEVDGLFNKNPWDLLRCSRIKSADQVGYFFSRRGDNKRLNRTTDSGFWKVTGRPRNVKGKNGNAMKRSLVFYEGRTPNAKGTPWVIHEYTFTSPVLDNKEGIFLCKLKKKEDEKDDTSGSESCQPTEVANDEIPENSTMFDPDEMLAALEEPDARDEAENNFSLAKQPLMHEDQVPSWEESTHSYEFSGFSDGVQHLYARDEAENDFSLAKQPLMHEDQVPSSEEFTHSYGVQHLYAKEAENDFCLAKQPLMNEDQVPSCEEFTYSYEFSGFFDEVQHLSNFDEQDDESWLQLLVDDDEPYPDERSNEQVVESEGCNLPVVDMSMTCPGESSRKRSRFEDGALCRAIENEGCLATYERVVSASSMLAEHAGSKKFQAMATFNAPNATLTAIEHDPHGRERVRYLSIINPGKWMPLLLAVDLHCIVHVALAESVLLFCYEIPQPSLSKRMISKFNRAGKMDQKESLSRGNFQGKIVS